MKAFSIMAALLCRVSIMPYATEKPFMLSVVLLNAVMLNAVMLSAIMLNAVMLNALYAEFRYAECPLC
jgi:hypothetical protein